MVVAIWKLVGYWQNSWYVNISIKWFLASKTALWWYWCSSYYVNTRPISPKLVCLLRSLSQGPSGKVSEELVLSSSLWSQFKMNLLFEDINIEVVKGEVGVWRKLKIFKLELTPKPKQGIHENNFGHNLCR